MRRDYAIMADATRRQQLADAVEGLLAQPIEAVARPVISDLERADDTASATRAPWSEAFEKIRVLGRGGMGLTIMARERASGDVVCIKELLGDVDLRMLVQEYRALSRMSHPNVVRMRDLAAHAEPPYIVADYIDGAHLGAYARGLASPTEREIAQLLRPIFDAIAALHSERIIHRDLKHENILVAVDGASARPFVIDLGLAVVDNFDHEMRITAEGPIVRGTPTYMAPEQIRGEVLTPACDVYAMGVVMYELICEREPFGRHYREIIPAKMSAKHGLTVRDGFWRKQWPVLGNLVRECTQPAIDRRPTAAIALAELDRFLDAH